jgi:photosystem I P700 chlorophyll a apoprotein A1
VSAFVASKGLFYSRGSRLAAAKAPLGFGAPCDGPGRGGSCQVSAWDHAFLGAFWAYNLLSTLLFSALWRLEGSVLSAARWTQGGGRAAAAPSPPRPARPAADFGTEAAHAQGWLRDFLWAQSAPPAQAYGSPGGAYTLLFLLSHFAWSLSLMFLFSGRGYWQELAESLLWAHAKLRAAPSPKARALSITQGRALGGAHFTAGGAGAAWSFALSRLLA